MALTIDSASVLRAMADHPDAFSAIAAEVHETVRKLLIKQIKAKTTDLPALRRLEGALGGQAFRMALDHLTSTDLKSLIKRSDPHSGLAKPGADLNESRRHLDGLASGRINIAAQPEKPVKATGRISSRSTKPRETSKIGTMLESRVHSGKPRATRTKKPA